MNSNEVRVLLLSDDRKLLRLLSRFLPMFGHAARPTTSREQASRVLQAWPCDLAIVDIGPTPSVTLEFCRQITSGGRDMPYLVLLAEPGRSLDPEQVLAAGVDDLLSKPVRFGELLSRLRAGLRAVHWRRRAIEQGDHDLTTRLPGRVSLLERLEALLPRAASTLVAVELDDLDAYEHQLGQRGGDELLRRTAVALRQAGVAVEWTAALGRGRFALLLAETCDHARIDLLRQAVLEATADADATSPPVTASIGFTTAGPLAPAPEPRGNALDTAQPPAAIVLQQAEYAAQLARRSGGNCTIRFGDLLDEEREWKGLAEPGRLFEQTTARDVMVPCALTLRTGDAPRYAARLFEQTRLAAIPVVDPNGKLAGIATPAMLAHATPDATAPEEASPDAASPDEAVGAVLQCMAPDVTTCGHTRPMTDLMRLLATATHGLVVVVRDGEPIGTVTPQDLSNLGRPAQHSDFQSPARNGSEYLLVPDGVS